MKKTIYHHGGGIRLLAYILISSFAAGCSGMGGGRLLPAAPSAAGVPSAPGAFENEGAGATHRFRVRIPISDAAGSMISARTRSVVVEIDGGGKHVFNTPPGSSACRVEKSDRLCTFSIDAANGARTTRIATYARANGQGAVLDRSVALLPFGTRSKIPMTVGPLVTSTADHGAGTLRTAVGQANDGDTITFSLANNATITLATTISVEKTVTIAGPGVAAGVSVSGNSAHQVFASIGNLTISGLIVRHGHAAASNSPGGAIFNTGTLTLIKDTIGSNTSIVSAVKGVPHAVHALPMRLHPQGCTTTFAQGGAVYNGGQLISSGTTYDSNVAPSDQNNCVNGQGGAVYNDVAGSFSSSGDTFTNNSAMMGGAVFSIGLGPVQFENDAFTGNAGCNATSGCPVTGCTASGCVTFAAGQGAAIFDGGAGIVVTNSTFTNNVAGGATSGSVGAGGAIVLATGQPTIVGSTFTGNQAGGGSDSCSYGQGGAIAAVVPLVANGDTFVKNTASGDKQSGGGAIWGQAALFGANDTFTQNSAMGTGSLCAGTAQGLGGAVYVSGIVTVNTSKFSKNVAVGNGEGAAGAIVGAEVSLNADTFDSNAAISTGGMGATASGGGGAVVTQTSANITNCSFAANHASIRGDNETQVFGGAVAAGGTVTSGNNVYSKNTVDAAKGKNSVAAAGAFALLNGSAQLTGDTFKGNTATSSGTAAGGALYMDAAFVLDGATISGNSTSAPQAVGGGLTAAANGQLDNDTIDSNVAKANGSGLNIGGGGGIYDSTGILISNSSISNNTASTEGGGVVTGSTEEYFNSTISGNTVTNANIKESGGGGIASGGGLALTDTTVANNTVTVSGAGSSGGGGIYAGGSGLILVMSTVSGNAVLGSAPGSGGGGIYDLTDTTLADSTISGNTSKLSGGGLYVVANKTIEADNVTFFANVAKAQGGNVFNKFAMTLTNSIAAGGSAAAGPDIDNPGTLTSGDYNIVQTAVAGHALMGTTTHDLTADPKLTALAKNGGPTQTNADQASSPGKAYIPYSGSKCGSVSLTYDQRGYTRGAGGHCDVGAYEFGGVASAIRAPAAKAPKTGARVAMRVTLPRLTLHVPRG